MRLFGVKDPAERIVPAAAVGDDPGEHPAHIGVETVPGGQTRVCCPLRVSGRFRRSLFSWGLSIIMLTFAPPSISVRRRICPLRKNQRGVRPAGKLLFAQAGVE